MSLIIWQSKREQRIFFKYLFITITCFLIVAIVNFGLIVRNLQPINIVLPFIIGSVVGALLGFNALLRIHLEKSNNTKTQFLSRMNHELRTPMSAIVGFAEFLNDGDNLTPDQKDGVKRIINAGNHTLGLINELLDFASVETGKVNLNIESIPVTSIMGQCIEITESLANKQKIKITHESDGLKDIRVNADEMRLKQIFINLLSNAVKYNSENGRITVRYKQLPSTVEILVTDTGNGIETAKLPYLFEPFNRLGAEKTKIQGTGVGLSITKTLIEMMSGKISCESTVGQGTTFKVVLPLAAK